MRKLVVVTALALAAAASAVWADAPADARKHIVIPAQPLSSALEALGRERDLQILYRSEVVGSLRTQPVSGDLTFNEALSLLLQDTGLTSRYVDAKTVTIVRVPAASGSSNASPVTSQNLAPSEATTDTSPAKSRGLIRLARADAAPQGANPQGTQAQSSNANGPQSEEVVVTGSRIQRAVSDASLPVTTMTAEDIALTGEARIAEVVMRLPYNSQGPSISGSGSAGSTAQGSQDANLRGLGSGRTLTLLNGRRLPPDGAAFAFSTNLNFIPSAAVDRIEVLRAGGSPVYGSDALGGVVNIVLKKDFEGGIVSVQYGDNSGVDANELSFSGTFGASTERGHILLSVEQRKIDPVRTANIPALIPDYTTLGTGFTSSGFPITFTVRDIFGDGTNISSPSIAAPNCAANLVRSTAGVTRVNPNTNATITYANTRECRQDTETFADFTSDSDLRSFFTTANYELTDGLSVFADVLWADFDTDSKLNGGLVSGLTMAANNPNNPTAAATVGNPVFGVTGPRVLAFGMLSPQPTYMQINTRQLLASGGFDLKTTLGQLTGYYHWAESESEQRTINTYNVAGIQAAINSGAINPFGAPANAVNAFNSNSGVFLRQPTGQMKTINLSWASQLPWTLPGGDILYSLGAETREEKYIETGAGSGPSQGFNAGFFLPANNKREVDSVFAELVFPITEAIEASWAGRWDSYDLPDFSELSHRLALRWRATPTLTFRGSYTQGIAAPNLYFVGSGTSTLNSSVVDTRRCQQANNNPADPRCQPTIVTQTLRGGADLGPETADNYTVGVVWSAVPDLTVALDLWRVKVDDQVGNLASQTVVNLEAQNINLAQFGVSLTRDSGGAITALTSGAANIPGFETDGLDLETKWRHDFGRFGQFSSSALLTFVNKYERPLAPGSPVLDAVGYVGVPEWKAMWSNSLTVGSFLGNVTLNYVDGFDGRSVDQAKLSNVASPGKIDSFMTVDASVTWTAPWRTKVFVGLRNMFDEQPTVNRLIYAANGFDVNNSNILGRVLVLRLTQDF